MELRQIKEFLAVLENGSIGDAARKLGISQPNLTREIKLLEKAVGGELFIRSSRGVQPTALARAFEPRARVIAGEVQRAERELDAFRGAHRGRIVLAGGPLAGYAILPPALARFRKTYPQVEIRLLDGQLRETIPQVLAGEIDLAFHAADDRQLPDDLSAEIILANEPVYVVARADHPLARPKRPTLKELAEANWILPSGPNYIRRRLEAMFDDKGLPVPHPAVELDNILFARRYLYLGDCLGLFARHVVLADIERGDLQTVAVPGMKWVNSVRAIRRRDVPLPPAAEMLLAEIRRVCAELRRR